MAIQSSSSSAQDSGTVTGNPAAPAKGKKGRAPRKTTGSASGRSAASRSASPTEIIYKEPPNPYLQPVPPFIWIDHPQERELLHGPVYVVRMGVGGGEQVEISIDNGPWQTCRLTSGYWWFDWAGIQPGRHTLVARMLTPDGRCFRTPPRACNNRF